MKIVYLDTSDRNKVDEGVKLAHRHIDSLCTLGFDAVISNESGERRTDFDFNAPIVRTEDLKMTSDDYVIVGSSVYEIPPVFERCMKVVFGHNPYQFSSSFGGDMARIRNFFREASAVIATSEYAFESLRFMFVSANIERVTPAYDSDLFSPSFKKDNIVAVLSNGRRGDSDLLKYFSMFRWIPAGWGMLPFEYTNENAVSEILKKSSMFLSLPDRDGMWNVAAEAMSCGCIVIGSQAYSCNEYMIPGISFPAREGDFLGMTKSVDDMMSASEEKRIDIARKASCYIRGVFNKKSEIKSVEDVWGKITCSSVEISIGTSERMKKEVVAYVPVYNEGPYLESILKWLMGRVAKIYVAESMIPWSPEAPRGGESKTIVDKVKSDCKDSQCEIVYMKLESGGRNEPPLIREAKQRNDILGIIREDGFNFVWMVEADEFYMDDDAVNLWTWFFEKASYGARTANCKWQTYWRSIHWRVDPPESFRPNVAFLSSCKFKNGRAMESQDEYMAVEVPDRLCVIRHYSWARTPSDVTRKLAAWGHSRELKKDWYNNVFMKWTPGCDMTHLHPTSPEVYKSVVQCCLPIPEAMKDHSFFGKDMIEENLLTDEKVVSSCIPVPISEGKPKRIKAVIMHHNNPENADKLFEQLSDVFDDVEIFDNGSEPSKIPIHVTRSRENVYWTGTWNEVMETCSDYDAVWVLGCDVEFRNSPQEYRNSIEECLSMNMGCWSPCMNGRAHDFMQEVKFTTPIPKSVKNIEGIALAVSGKLMREVKQFEVDSKIGYGQDFWLCYRSRNAGMANYIDGGVCLFHPGGTGYDASEALNQMNEAFGNRYGIDYRRRIFEYEEIYDFNLVKENVVEEVKEVEALKEEKEMKDKKFTIVTVDNGWGLSEFLRITSKLGDVRTIIMRKGVIENVPIKGVEFVPYDESLELLIKEADVAFFPRVGMANKDDYLKILKAGVPTVVRESSSQNAIQHEKNGWIFRDEIWAQHWLSFVINNPNERKRIRDSVNTVPIQDQKIQPTVVVQPLPFQFGNSIIGRVSVITPTYKRDVKIINRCVGSMLLQTYQDWEQIVCSDGEFEQDVANFVTSVNDKRVKYANTNGKKDGDFGNTVRSEMLKCATGEFVFFFDDDNVILPDYLEKMISVLKRNGEKHDVAICKVMHFGPLNEKEIGKAPKVLSGYPVKLYHVDPLQFLIRTDVMKKVGWDTKVGYLSDGVSLEKLADSDIVRVDEVLGIHM